MDAQNHTDILTAFGGAPGLAREIGIEPKLACHWPSRGIPSKFWPAVERACRAKAGLVGVTAETLSRLPRSPNLGPAIASVAA